MSPELALNLLKWIALIAPIGILLCGIVLLICIGKMAAGERLRWPWKR